MAYVGPVSRQSRVPETAPGRPGSRLATINAAPRGSVRGLPPVRDESNANLAFAAGLALGAAIGAGVALLFAPQSGEDARRAIARTGHRLRRRGGDAWIDLGDELRRMRRRRAQRRSLDRLEASSL